MGGGFYNNIVKMLNVSNLHKYFGKVKAVDGIDFEVNKGEIVGFLGPNGAGKTTTMRLITSFLTPTKGKVTINGKSPKKSRSIIGYLPEENPLYSKMTPLEYLHFIGKMHKMSLNNLNKQSGAVTAKCGLTEVINRPIETLSRGYRQRVGLAATLIHNPQIIVMDEPTSGLDPNQQDEIKNLIKLLAKDKAVLFSTHILSEAESICQRALIIHRGEIVAKANVRKMKKGQLEKLFKQKTKDEKPKK
jgi:ABC-2 type transport system ATP-binding protein